MAILTEGRILVTDASNVPINGGKVRIYDTGTTNLTPTFSDAALSVPLTNPVAANASGFTPVIFAAEGTNVDITYLTSADAVVTGRTYTNVPFLGADAGDFSRTVTGDGRFKITGSGGGVLLQAGDPSPDNTGGTLTIEGWAGTQADLITLDAATTNTTGAITENSKKLIGVVNTAATAFSAAATVDIPLTQNPSGILAWEVEIFRLICSTTPGVVIGLQFSYDGGATYKSGASDYAYAYQYKNLGDANPYPTFAEDDAHSQIVLTSSVDFSASPAWLTMRILTVASGTQPTMVKGEVMCLQGSGTLDPNLNLFRGHGLGSYGKATHVRLTPASGTLTGSYRVTGLRGFGE